MMNEKEVIMNALEACHSIRLLHLHGSIADQASASHTKMSKKERILSWSIFCHNFICFYTIREKKSKSSQKHREENNVHAAWNVCCS